MTGVYTAVEYSPRHNEQAVQEFHTWVRACGGGALGRGRCGVVFGGGRWFGGAHTTHRQTHTLNTQTKKQKNKKKQLVLYGIFPAIAAGAALSALRLRVSRTPLAHLRAASATLDLDTAPPAQLRDVYRFAFPGQVCLDVVFVLCAFQRVGV